ncbi:hypothetical protein LIER_20782 [Lithospermum erythrorhizon]|uniref:Uncharacterized protein n=1 Tax=Lithospermum erythrorhizon TaxID=34254 RepID=A0AAV3QMS6_LITER
MGFTGCVKRPIGLLYKTIYGHQYTTKADKGASFFESRQNKTGFCIIRDSVFGVPSRRWGGGRSRGGLRGRGRGGKGESLGGRRWY